MFRTSCTALGLSLALATGAGQAAPAAVAPAASAASAPAKASAKTPPHIRVIEDDNVRIEESKARGQTQRITVHLKGSAAKDYEIIVPPGGKDLSQDKGTTGQRAWSLFSF